MAATTTSDSLTVSLVEFRDRVQAISRRGKATIKVMETEDAPAVRVESERQALKNEVLHLRIRTTQEFGERLTRIIKENGLN